MWKFRCEIRQSVCSSNPCNYGTCNDLTNSYTCSCYLGFTGNTCQIAIDCKYY